MPRRPKSPRGAVAVTATGLALTVGALLFAAPRAAQFPDAGDLASILDPAWAESQCDKFLKNTGDKDPSNYATALDPANQEHKVHRSKKWKQGDLQRGMWIGAVYNDGASMSGFYKDLPAKTWGCIFFVRYPTGSDEPDQIYGDAAYLHIAGSGTTPKQLSRVLFCLEEVDHNLAVSPHIESWPKTCKKVKATFVENGTITSRSVSVGRGRNLLSESDIKSGLQLPDDVPGGPWFPCEPAGCCRAY